MRVNLVCTFLILFFSVCILWSERSLDHDCRGGICLVAVE